MPHIHTGPGQHDSTVTAFIVRLDKSEPLALLHMHKKLHRLLPVGGHVELDETVWGAMAHELHEESGYTFDQLEIMQPALRIDPSAIKEMVIHPQPLLVNTHDFSPTHFHNDIDYFFTTHSDPKSRPDVGESLDLRWLSRDEIVALSDDVIFRNTRMIYVEIFDHFLTEWEAVPTSNYRTDKIISFGDR